MEHHGGQCGFLDHRLLRNAGSQQQYEQGVRGDLLKGSLIGGLSAVEPRLDIDARFARRGGDELLAFLDKL
jgi:hypothetical protein